MCRAAGKIRANRHPARRTRPASSTTCIKKFSTRAARFRTPSIHARRSLPQGFGEYNPFNASRSKIIPTQNERCQFIRGAAIESREILSFAPQAR
jgi:hypothetical protein